MGDSGGGGAIGRPAESYVTAIQKRVWATFTSCGSGTACSFPLFAADAQREGCDCLRAVLPNDPYVLVANCDDPRHERIKNLKKAKRVCSVRRALGIGRKKQQAAARRKGVGDAV